MIDKLNNDEKARISGDCFRRIREDHRLSLQILSDETGIPANKLQYLEKGTNVLTSGEIKKLESYYQESVSKFLDFSKDDADIDRLNAFEKA